MWYCAFHFRKGRFKTIYLILSNRYCDFPQNNVQNPNNVEGLGWKLENNVEGLG